MRGDAEYGVVVPTLADANAATRTYSVFMVSALTPNPYLYFDSPVEAGYSIDNLAPGAPTPFFAAYVAGVTQLHWGASTAGDFATFRLYRAASADFVPAASNLVAAATCGCNERWWWSEAVVDQRNSFPTPSLRWYQLSQWKGGRSGIWCSGFPRPRVRWSCRKR